MSGNTGTIRAIYKVNKDGRAKPQPKLYSSWVEARTKEMLKKYWQDYRIWNRLWSKHFIKTEVAVCIAFADTHLWYATKTTNNVWNVWNNDRWDTRTPKSLEQWIEAIYLTLNNKYLWMKQTIWDLSFAWSCKNNCSKVYATSNSNRENNVLNCLSNIYQTQIESDFNFRK